MDIGRLANNFRHAKLCLIEALLLLDQMTVVDKACWQSSADAK